MVQQEYLSLVEEFTSHADSQGSQNPQERQAERDCPPTGTSLTLAAEEVRRNIEKYLRSVIRGIECTQQKSRGSGAQGAPVPDSAIHPPSQCRSQPATATPSPSVLNSEVSQLLSEFPRETSETVQAPDNTMGLVEAKLIRDFLQNSIFRSGSCSETGNSGGRDQRGSGSACSASPITTPTPSPAEAQDSEKTPKLLPVFSRLHTPEKQRNGLPQCIAESALKTVGKHILITKETLAEFRLHMSNTSLFGGACQGQDIPVPCKPSPASSLNPGSPAVARVPAQIRQASLAPQLLPWKKDPNVLSKASDRFGATSSGSGFGQDCTRKQIAQPEKGLHYEFLDNVRRPDGQAAVSCRVVHTRGPPESIPACAAEESRMCCPDRRLCSLASEHRSTLKYTGKTFIPGSVAGIVSRTPLMSCQPPPHNPPGFSPYQNCFQQQHRAQTHYQQALNSQAGYHARRQVNHFPYPQMTQSLIYPPCFGFLPMVQPYQQGPGSKPPGSNQDPSGMAGDGPQYLYQPPYRYSSPHSRNMYNHNNSSSSSSSSSSNQPYFTSNTNGRVFFHCV
ncbi:hypothetical protein AOXY_G30429 [Acipenser oxyrinchus oxyrinchus]|uniref:Uncharacterized protein n=1 Tax=Acipenser oxyrinchus oxyrinchus TaxID=40147 RepID=A0AAD8FTB7_ACIOX|nr:hypothetical protein AOXY_G30429 [Acipenser oxyrinchus oxyrinchus]